MHTAKSALVRGGGGGGGGALGTIRGLLERCTVGLMLNEASGLYH